mmetsp:Transcript_935/g.1602  ORF Transcript_935/g.1602 Transcript_935/m.1602 type:complete len:95 (+) Transcript_935:1-285(+)
MKLREGLTTAIKSIENGVPNNNKWTSTMTAVHVFRMLHDLMISLGDFSFTHRFAVLVNGTSASDFLLSLDKNNVYKVLPPSKRASWFSGQQISN